MRVGRSPHRPGAGPRAPHKNHRPSPRPAPKGSAGPPLPPARSAAKSSARAAPLRMFAVTTPGLEPVLRAELQELPGACELLTLPGGVEFTGDLSTLYRANLWLRSASRVLLRLEKLRALHFASLRRQVAQLPFEHFATGPVGVSVAATAHHCRLYHTGGIAERIALGIADRGLSVQADPAAGTPELHLVVRGQDDEFTLSLDTSGELLHRRGYRTLDTGAPLRETLAAGLLQLCGWDGSMPLFDPTCGSGTLVIEAALLAARRPAGRNRTFSFQRWPTFVPSLWSELLTEADAGVRPLPPGLLYAADIDANAIAVARHNAARAGVESMISWTVADARRSVLPGGPPGLVLCNPPYGVRLASPQRLYQELGRLVRSAAGWRLGILTSVPHLARAAGLVTAGYALSSGGLRVALYVSEPPLNSAAAPPPAT